MMKRMMKSCNFPIMVSLLLLVVSSASAQLVGDEVTCYRTSSPPVIDGKLDEWLSNNAITDILAPDSDSVAPFRNNALPADGDDCSFEMFAMWDENNFYVAFGVIDDEAIMENPTADVWDGPDFIEMYVDPTNKSNADRGLSWCIGTHNGNDPIAFQTDPMEREALDYDMAMVASGNPLGNGKAGWVLELRLGKDSFDPEPITLEPGEKMGMIIIMSDTDKDGVFKRMFIPGDGNSQDIHTDSSFLLVFSEEATAVSPIGSSTATWGQIKSLD